MKNLIISAVVGLLIGAISMYFIRDCETKIVKVEVEVEVPIPGVKDSFAYEVPILKPYPVENPTNTELADKLANAKSQIDSLKLLKDFAKPRLYSRRFTDSIQHIDVDMIATGSVDSVKVSYDIFPKTITHTTTIDVPIPTQASFWGKASTVIPFGESPLKATVKPGIMFMTKKGNVAYDLEGDFTNKSVEVGAAFRF